MLFLRLIPLLFIVYCCTSPNSSGSAQTRLVETDRLVLTTDLVSDSAAIKEYERYHSKDGVWPEIGRANLRSGIKKMEIYRFGTRLVLIMEITKGMDSKTLDSLYQSTDPKISQWGKIMSRYQVAPLGADTMAKWAPMKRIHAYEGGQFQ